MHGERRDVSPEIAVAQTAGRCRGERRRGEGVIVKYDYVKPVLSAPPRLVDAFGTRVWRRAGFVSFWIDLPSSIASHAASPVVL